MAIGEAGATNAALFALRLLSVEDQAIATALADFAEEQGKIAESQMSSTKAIGIIGGGQLGRMMAICGYLHGTQVVRWIQQLICPASRVAK